MPLDSSSTVSTTAVMNERPRVSRSTRKRSAAFDDDVEPAVVEALEHVGHAREGSDLAHALLVGVDSPNSISSSRHSPISSQ